MPPIDTHPSALMRRCLALAQQAAGQTAPNPMVGAIVVKNGQIIGEGFHPKAGEPHAEVFALRAAGEAAQGATLYVNLEPCHHTGRTPPCTAAILKAGIKTVIIGMNDPNPIAQGGIAHLRAAGLEVITGIEEQACRQLNEAFIHRLQHQRPLGIFKYAMTLDGKLATETGHSIWVTGTEARQVVHQLRGTCDAIVIGSHTLRQDNPHLTTHGVCQHNPLRIVMSRTLNLPTTAHLWQTTIAPTLVFTEATQSPLQAQLEKQGVEVVTLDVLTPDKVMSILYSRGLLSVLWECGGTLAAAAIKDRVIQKVYAFVAPKIVGGQKAPMPVDSIGITQMQQALSLRSTTFKQIGEDWLIEGYLDYPNSASIPL